MSILVIGATGFIGAPLVRALRARGEDVIAASRAGAGPDGVACDRRDPAALARLAQGRRATTVVDLLAYTTADTLPLMAALAGRIDRYVLVSSMDVYRNYEGLHRKAQPEPVGGPLDEASPLRTTRFPYRTQPRRPADAGESWLDDYDKIPLETALRESGMRHTILRLPMVYGPGDRQRRFAWILSPMLAGRARIVTDPAWAAWRTTYGFVSDVADAVARCACASTAVGGTFNLGEADPPDHRAWIARFAGALHWEGEVDQRPAPPDSPLAALNLAYPLIADTRAFRETFAWAEPTPLEGRLAQTVADHRAAHGPGA
jgi:nucleoside-diphosphate-sugar epimerase